MNSFNSLVLIFVDWKKKAFRELPITKNKKKGFEILKFMDFHFKFVDFACRDSTLKCSF